MELRGRLYSATRGRGVAAGAVARSGADFAAGPPMAGRLLQKTPAGSASSPGESPLRRAWDGLRAQHSVARELP
ncbi:MAG: hypothetical protein QOG21_2294 [Actinomycetota bacterium]|jgi:hypothetical protein|nr:hypothetical protein [Actinomycetota bacterium]